MCVTERSESDRTDAEGVATQNDQALALITDTRSSSGTNRLLGS
jgi:hypothetical protein